MENRFGMMFSGIADESEEYVELIPELDEMNEGVDLPSELLILPIKNTVLFPGIVIPITVGRQKSIKLVKTAYAGDRIIGVVAQKNVNAEDPSIHDVYSFGTVAKILKMLVLPDGNTTIIIQGKSRFQIDEMVSADPFLKAKYHIVEELFPPFDHEKTVAIVDSLKNAASTILKLNPEIPEEAQVAIDNIESPDFLTHFLSSNINAKVSEKQELLEENDGLKRATMLLEHMMKDIKMLEIKQEINERVNDDIDQQQRDYYIRQQIKALQDELGLEGPDHEVEALREKGRHKKWPKEVGEHFNKELDKVLRMNPSAAEYPVAMNYAELLLDLPWNEFTKDSFDLARAQKVLDKDHYGLEDVKERILEYLAVLKLKKDMKSPILCLLGPPGVGKTSLGKSVAKALKRNYVRIALGGLHDEAEIRGHRKTYIGAMPGKLIQNIQKSKSANPVFILDEIDKINRDFRGDPSSALLEVLDPEQNNSFVDNYLEVPFDLSKVLFIATANGMEGIHPALRDRMEIIELSGYTLEEKLEIAKQHLVPKQKKEHGLKSNDIQFDDDALVQLIDGYTRESGVRNLERKIGSVVRKTAKAFAMKEEYNKEVGAEEIKKLLGANRFDKEIYTDNDYAGVVTGLAWTSVGGEILFIESSLYRGKGNLIISGQLGDVMQESAKAALSFVKSHAAQLKIDYKVFENYDLHIHVPSGAVPKDGPSAGITILTAIASIFTQRKVKANLAMTGEITLRGKVMPVGGIKEKILAAKRAGINHIILSNQNKKDIDEIKDNYLENLMFSYVDHADEVLDIALLEELVDHPMVFEVNEKR